MEIDTLFAEKCGIDLLKQAGLSEPIGTLYQLYVVAELEHPDGDAAARPLEEIEKNEHRPSPGWL